MILQDSSTPKNGLSLSTKLVERASEYVLELMQALDPIFVFHNQRYTVQTVHACSLIARAEEISLQDQFVLKISAWFHHTGYLKTSDKHREISATLATKFLTGFDVDSDTIDLVCSTILQSGTAWDVVTPLDMVLYDADYYFLAASNYKEMLDRRKEEINQLVPGLSTQQWTDFVEECFVQHQYLTNYGQEFLHNLRRVNYLNYKHAHAAEIRMKEVFHPRSNY